MRKRPEDFYGYDDYTGGDPQDDIDRIKQKQKEYDEWVEKLPWYKKIFVKMFS